VPIAQGRAFLRLERQFFGRDAGKLWGFACQAAAVQPCEILHTLTEAEGLASIK